VGAVDFVVVVVVVVAAVVVVVDVVVVDGFVVSFRFLNDHPILSS